MVNQDSYQEGLEDGRSGKYDTRRYYNDEVYKEGVNAGEGIRKAEQDLRNPHISQGWSHGRISEEGGKTYIRVMQGQSPSHVFHDEYQRNDDRSRSRRKDSGSIESDIWEGVGEKILEALLIGGIIIASAYFFGSRMINSHSLNKTTQNSTQNSYQDPGYGKWFYYNRETEFR